MGQCFGSLWKRSTSTRSLRPKDYKNGHELGNEEEENAFQNSNPGASMSQSIETVSKKFRGFFSVTRSRAMQRPSAYLLQDNEDDSHIELYDMVADPLFFTANGHGDPPNAIPDAMAPHQRHRPMPPRDQLEAEKSRNLPKNLRKPSRTYQSQHQQPDLRQVVGLRNTLTCCVLPRQSYGKLDNEYGDETSEGGAAFIILNPRNLNGHATIPAPPESRSHLSGELGHSKWSVNSTASIDGGRPASIDLEWENDDDFAAAAAANVVTSTNNDNNKLNNKSCDPDTCSIIESISTNVPCTKGGGGGGSRTSSHISIPGLDWDSQVDNDDLVSLNNPETDFETDQLITEIELLTSRALQETHQWGSSNSPSKKVGAQTSISVIEANNNPTSAAENWTTLANN